MAENWRGVYASRFVERIAIQRPTQREWGKPVYTRLTDEQIEQFPESVRGIARAMRDFSDYMFALWRPLGPARSARSSTVDPPDGPSGAETGPS